MVQNTKNNQPYWLENLKKAISYVNSEEFLNDLESGKYDTDRNSIIYLNLEDGTVSTTPVFGATLKTVKLDKFREKITHQNKDINPEKKDSYNSLFPYVDSKVKKQWFNSFYAQLVLPSHKVYKTFGVDYPKELDDIMISNTKLVLEWFDINSLFVGGFVGEMLEYIPEEKLSSFDVTVVLDSSTPTMLVSWDEKFKFSPSAYYFDGDIPESDTFFDVPVEMAFDLLSKFKSVKFRLGDDVCEPSIWPEMTSKLIDFWVLFSIKNNPKFDFKVDDAEFIEYLKFGENDPKKFIYFNKKMNDDYFTSKKGMLIFEDLQEYYETLIKKIS